MKGKEELLNTRFALSEFKLEEGENLLKEMQELRDELSNYEFLNELGKKVLAQTFDSYHWIR